MISIGGSDEIKYCRGSAILTSIFVIVLFAQEDESACIIKWFVLSFPPHGIFMIHTWPPLRISISSFYSNTLILNRGLTAVMSHLPSPKIVACSGYGKAMLSTLQVERALFSFPNLRFAVHDVGFQLITKWFRHIA